MSRRLLILVLALSVLSLTLLPSFHSAAAASQADSVQLSLSSSVNSTSMGIPVDFSGAVSGGNVTSVVYVVVGPDGSTFNASVNTVGSTFNFSYAFDNVGNWTVFCTAGDLSNPLAVSDPLFIYVDAGAPSNFLGVPFVWLGVAILLVSAASLVYLVYAIRKRSQEVERKAAGGGEADLLRQTSGAVGCPLPPGPLNLK
jgi:hypothetical protein